MNGTLPVLPTLPTIPWGANRFDPSAASFFVRAGITNGTQQNAVNRLVIDLKAAAIWSKMVDIYPFVGGTAGNHAVNLVSESFLNTWSGGITHDANGVRGNGTTGYGNTGLTTSSAGMLLNSSHCSVYINQAETIVGNQLGQTNGGVDPQSIQLAINLGPGTAFWDCYGTSTGRVSGTAGATTGFYVGSRNASNSNALYRNASVVISNATASETVNSTLPVFILARATISTATTFSDARVALISFGLGLSSTEVTAFTTAVQTFQTSLSRQV